MKKSAKERYQELLDYIEFPVMIYVSETGRVIALNSYGKNILGNEIKNINEVFAQDLLLRLKRVIVDVGRKIFYNIRAQRNTEMMELDMEVNGIKIDNKHLVICFFEKSFKQVFVKKMSKQVPRMFYKNDKFEYIHGSELFLQDAKVDLERFVKNENVLDEGECSYIRNADRDILVLKNSEFNAVLNGIVPGCRTFFIRLHRIPVINNNNEAVGVLGIYTLILSRAEYKEIFEDALRENQVLNHVIEEAGLYVLKFEMSTGWPIHYVSPNFRQLAYIRYGLYDGKVFWKDIVHPEDSEQICSELQKVIGEGKEAYPVLSYRIRNFSGDYIWVTDETYAVEQHQDIWYRESVIRLSQDKKTE